MRYIIRTTEQRCELFPEKDGISASNYGKVLFYEVIDQQNNQIMLGTLDLNQALEKQMFLDSEWARVSEHGPVPISTTDLSFNKN